MMIFVFSFVALVICVLGMSLGVLYGRAPIKGACGNLNHLPGLKGQRINCCGGCETKKENKELKTTN